MKCILMKREREIFKKVSVLGTFLKQLMAKRERERERGRDRQRDREREELCHR